MVAIWPVWPPASVPWATTMSQPASTAAMVQRLAAHVHHQHVVVVALVDDIAGDAEAGYEDSGTAVDDRLHLGRHVLRRCCQQVDAEGLGGGGAGRS